jgi:thiosulfate/3-mercaptopyruvate sulfurtransferase
MTTRVFASLLVLPAMLAAAPAVRSDMLVSTAWLAQHLTDPNIVVLHVGRARAGYDKGHIPGARFMALSDLIVTRDGILNELPPAADLKKAFEAVGISDDSRVILYGDGSVLPATRAYFTLDYLGHGDRAAILDGGIEKWRAESRSISTEAPQVQAGHFTPRPKPDTVVGIEAVKDLSWAASNASPGSTVLLDVRGAGLYHGKSAPPEVSRPGHIPGAVNLDWMDNQAGKSTPELKPQAELRKIYEAAGITPDRPVVTYCNTGMQATQSYFTLKYLGYDVHLYDGSFSEWSNSKGTEVDK